MEIKLVKIDNYLYLISRGASSTGDWTIFTSTSNGEIVAYSYPVQAQYTYSDNGLYNFKVLASDNPEMGLPAIKSFLNL